MTVFWKDIDNEFNRKNNGDIVDMTNDAAIINSLTNIFQSIQGSRRMLPEFALPIYRLLFEPMDENTASRLASMILDAIERWETRIVVEGLSVFAEPDNNLYRVTLNFYVGTTGDESQLITYEDIIRAK